MKKLTRCVRKVNAEVIGLDVHKDVIAFARLDRRGDEIEAGQLSSTPDTLVRWLDRKVGRKKTHIALEACGGMLWIYDLLVSKYGEDRVHVAQSKRIRAIANSQEKNDANDAWWLAYLTHEGRLPESFIPVGELRELRVATRERRAAIQLRTRVVVQLRSHLRQMGIRLPTAKLASERSWTFLRRLSEKTAGSLGMALLFALDLIEQLELIVKDWEERIRKLVEGSADVQALKEEIPGVGTVLAATIAAEAGPIRRFRSARAFARYTGLTLSDRSSGGQMIHGSITREGSPHLRWALTTAAVCCCRAKHGAPKAVGDWIRAKQRRMGVKPKAHVAAARKLAESIWRLFTWGECFDAAKPFGGRPTEAAA
jgi:transposase